MRITTGDKSSSRFFITEFAARSLLALIIWVLCVTALRAQAIQIKLVDGKTGRPVAGACVGAMMTKDYRKRVSIPMDKDGIASLRLTQKDNEVGSAVDTKLGCGGDGAINPVFKYADSLTTYTYGDHPSCAFPESMPNARYKGIDFSTKDVLEHGVVSANTCSRVTASPQPGEIILFVRPRNFREKVKDWLNRETFPF